MRISDPLVAGKRTNVKINTVLHRAPEPPSFGPTFVDEYGTYPPKVPKARKAPDKHPTESRLP